MGLIIPKGTSFRLRSNWDERSFRDGRAAEDIAVESVIRQRAGVVTVEGIINQNTERLRIIKVRKEDLVMEAPRGTPKVTRLPLI